MEGRIRVFAPVPLVRGGLRNVDAIAFGGKRIERNSIARDHHLLGLRPVIDDESLDAGRYEPVINARTVGVGGQGAQRQPG